MYFSQASEIALCLDVLGEPDHHPDHREWAYRVLSRMSVKERADFQTVGEMVGGFLRLDSFFGDDTDLIGADGFTQDYQSFLSDPANYREPGDERLSADDRVRLVEFLGYFHRSYFKPLIDQRETAIRERILYGRQRIADSSVEEFVGSISDRVVHRPSKDVIVLDKWLDMDFDAASMKGFGIVVSMFAFPHMMIGYDAGESFVLAWDIPFNDTHRRSAGIDQISGLAFALSDKSRLRILLLIANQEMNQKEIGERMGYAKSTISRHMAILEEAGLITKRAGGNKSLFFILNRKRIEGFSELLLNWIG